MRLQPVSQHEVKFWCEEHACSAQLRIPGEMHALARVHRAAPAIVHVSQSKNTIEMRSQQTMAFARKYNGKKRSRFTEACSTSMDSWVSSRYRGMLLIVSWSWAEIGGTALANAASL